VLIGAHGGKKGTQKVLPLLVKWDGNEEEHNSWEPEWNLLGCDDLVREYKTT
jgi:hypothetical protein